MNAIRFETWKRNKFEHFLRKGFNGLGDEGGNHFRVKYDTWHVNTCTCYIFTDKSKTEYALSLSTP